MGRAAAARRSTKAVARASWAVRAYSDNDTIDCSCALRIAMSLHEYSRTHSPPESGRARSFGIALNAAVAALASSASCSARDARINAWAAADCARADVQRDGPP